MTSRSKRPGELTFQLFDLAMPIRRPDGGREALTAWRDLMRDIREAQERGEKALAQVIDGKQRYHHGDPV